MRRFRKLVDLHQKETEKYKPNNNFSMAATEGAGLDGAGRDGDNVEAAKLKLCLETFALDDFGKHGI